MTALPFEGRRVDTSAAGATEARHVIEECERILSDPDEPAERKALAEKWLDRLVHDEVREPSLNAYGVTAVARPAAGGSHSTSGGGSSWASDLRYDGWVD